MTDWSSLERGLLRDVFTRLDEDVDAASFRQVCHHWRVAAGAGAPVPRPWFIFVTPSTSIHARHTYLHPARRHGRSRVRPVHADDGNIAVKEERVPAHVRGASRGWLAVSVGDRFFLRDPISCAEVPLPAIDTACELVGVFLSDDPLALPGGGFTALAFLKRADVSYMGHMLAFYRPGDSEWTQIDPDDGHLGLFRFYRGLEFFRGRAYVLLHDYRVAICDVDTRKLLVSSVRLDYTGYDPVYVQECLVQCGADLLFVQVMRIFVARARSPPCCVGRSYDLAFSARVVKIEVCADDGTPLQWSEVGDIGDHALFVASHRHGFALRASGFPSVKAGCIYHFSTHMNTKKVSGMVVSDLRECPHRHENVRKLPLVGPWRALSWFCPRWPILDTTTKRR